MKQFLISSLLLLATLQGVAQQITPALTVYQEFQPATVLLTSGKTLKLPLANVFLKNSSLIYMSGDVVKEADTKALQRVDFKDRSYIPIENQLVYRVDSVGGDVLYCAKVIDLKSFKQQRANSANITNIDLSNITNTLGYTTIDAGGRDSIEFPVIPVYYFKIGEKIVLAHERHLKRALPKEKVKVMESVMNLPGFSWTNEKYLMILLEKIR